MVNILKGISLQVEAGERVGLVGPSGSGKSSLMMLIGGLERPTGGRVRVAGQNLSALDEDGLARFRRDNVGIVFQNFHLVPTMTAMENVALPAEFAGRRDAFERATEGLNAVGLGHRLEHYPGQLSGGEQQMLAFARALVLNPKLLLLDEPLEGLAPIIVEELLRSIVRVVRDEGMSAVIVEQNPRMILPITHSAVVLDRGTIVHRGLSEDLLADRQTLDRFLAVAQHG